MSAASRRSDTTEGRLNRLLEELASKEPAPASGSASAAVVAAASALLEKCARLSASRWPGAAGALERAHSLRIRSEELVEMDLHSYLAFVAAAKAQSDVAAALSATIDVPLDIARSAVEAGELAEQLAERGNPRLWADAVVAAILSAAAAESAALLVAVNVGDSVDDPRLEAARGLAAAASVRARRLSSRRRRGAPGRAPGRSRDTGRR